MKLETLNESIEKLDSKINIDKGKLNIIKEELDKVNSKLDESEEYLDILENVKILFQKTAEYAREQAKKNIEITVTKCLQYIFETDIEFLIELSESRNMPIADFYVQSNFNGYSIKTKPELARGGGVVDIISIALRIAFLQITNPKLEGPLILDEPGKHVSDDYIFNLGELLKNTANTYERQIIMVTHNKYLSQICDKSFIVELKDGISNISENIEI